MVKANTFAFDANMHQWAFRAFNNLELNRLINDLMAVLGAATGSPYIVFILRQLYGFMYTVQVANTIVM